MLGKNIGHIDNFFGRKYIYTDVQLRLDGTCVFHRLISVFVFPMALLQLAIGKERRVLAMTEKVQSKTAR